MRLLAAGAVALGVVATGWALYAAAHPAWWLLYPADLKVYWDGGLIARHAGSSYDPTLAGPLYGWASPTGLKFTYPPFAAVAFGAVSVLPWWALPRLSEAVGVAALGVAAWFTMAGLGYTSRRARLGGALLGTAAGLATEPVFRTLYLGQVNLILMALIVWDLTRPADPDGKGWSGLATGVAAGIKLTPLVFIPYLLATRRLRQAGLAAAGFAATVAVGFVAMPRNSAEWWLHGLFLDGGRTGFVGWGGNQSLYGLITRLSGSLSAATPVWIAAALVVAAVGLLSAAVLSRAGHPVLGILVTALVGLLDSPVSWDHHWVWVVPGVLAAAHYAARAWAGGRLRAAAGCAATAAFLLLVMFPWPGGLWSVTTTGPGNFTSGLLWAAPNSPVWCYVRLGDKPWFLEYHWRGPQVLAGNAYVLTGLAALVALTALAGWLTGRLRVGWLRAGWLTGGPGALRGDRVRARCPAQPLPERPARRPGGDVPAAATPRDLDP